MASIPRETDNYSSPAMQARRERILEEVLNLIAEQGLSGFSLGELCRRAGVAKQTIYYAFGSREGLISAAIRNHFDKSERQIPYHFPTASLERLLERTVGVGQRNLQIRNYVAAITSFYYGGSNSPELWRALHDITTLPQRPYVEGLRRSRQLQAWVKPQWLIDELDAQKLSASNDWVNGRIGDDELIDSMVLNQLTFLLGSVRGAARTHIERTLRELTKVGAVAYVAELAKDHPPVTPAA